MRRIALVGVVAIGLMVSRQALGVAPSLPPSRTTFRFISLAEAAQMALVHAGHRVEIARHGSVIHPDPGLPPLEAERRINQLLLNVEAAYWNLYAEHWKDFGAVQLAAAEKWARKEAEQVSAEDQFRTVLALLPCSAANRRIVNILNGPHDTHLRAFVGLGAKDGTVLVPVDAPRMDRVSPDWTQSWRLAKANRPELKESRREVWIRSFVVDTDRVVRFLYPGMFSDEEVRMPVRVWRVPPSPPADTDTALVRLARAREIVLDQELKCQSYLANYYRRLHLNHEQLAATQARRRTIGDWLLATLEAYDAGRETPVTVVRMYAWWMEAVVGEYETVAAYNNALAGFEFSKGTIQGYDNMRLAGGKPGERSAVRPTARSFREARLALPSVSQSSRFLDVWR